MTGMMCGGVRKGGMGGFRRQLASSGCVVAMIFQARERHIVRRLGWKIRIS